MATGRSAARVSAAHRAIEDAERRPQRALGDDGEDAGVAPVLIDVGPVVERRDDGAAVAVGFEPVAVDVPDLRLDLAEDGPGDQPVLLELADASP